MAHTQILAHMFFFFGGGGGGSRNKDFCTVLQTDLTRSLVLSLARAIG